MARAPRAFHIPCRWARILNAPLLNLGSFKNLGVKYSGCDINCTRSFQKIYIIAISTQKDYCLCDIIEMKELS